jgi:hypothetical protein
MTDTVLADSTEGGLLDLIEATAVMAGVRAAYVCVVLPLGADSDTWLTRVKRRGQSVHRVLHASTRRVSNAQGIGALRWHTLLSILDDAAGSDLLPATERRLAAATVSWVRDRLAQRDAGVRLA